MTILNERIKQSRLARGLTLAQVADAIGVKEATAQRYESGDIKNIKHETILHLSELFSVSPAYLMWFSFIIQLSPSLAVKGKFQDFHFDGAIHQ